MTPAQAATVAAGPAVRVDVLAKGPCDDADVAAAAQPVPILDAPSR